MKAKQSILTIATCQHPVSADVSENLKFILRQVKTAKSKKADIVHFSECNLSGYGGIDFFSYDKLNYDDVLSAIKKIQRLAGEMQVGIILGTHLFIKKEELPRIALLYVNKRGDVEAKYEKRVLYGALGTHDHLYYTPGLEPVVFEINGTQCGMLICHEWRYPELIREYKRLGVKLLFHSWYDAGYGRTEYENHGIHSGGLIVGATQGYAANNHLWISGSNTSNRESCFPSFVVRPDGRIANKLNRNTPGVLITQIDFHIEFEDPSFFGRQRFL